MLACVCQPADPNIFRHSPIPLGAAPLKITAKGAIPKVIPGRSVRITEPIVSTLSKEKTSQEENELTVSTLISMNISLAEPNREALLNFGGEGQLKEKSKETSISLSKLNSFPSKFSPTKRKCARKIHVKHKLRKSGKHEKTDIIKISCDKENVSLSSENAACDKTLTEKPDVFPRVRYHIITTLTHLHIKTIFHRIIDKLQ